MKRLLIVSSDNDLVADLSAAVARYDGQCVATADIHETMRALYDMQPGAVVLDLKVGSGAAPWLIFQRIREVCDTPILVFAADASEETRINALERGADDAVSVTCTPSEILMRVRNLTQRRAVSDGVERRTYAYNGLEYDVMTRSLNVCGRSVVLTSAESRLLLCFLRQPDRFYSCSELTAALWGEIPQDHSSVIKVYIHRLRRKINELLPEQPYITNHRSIGYRFR
jgi:DNA-binding response OmpR family regulator